MPDVKGYTSRCPLMITSLKTDVHIKCEQGQSNAFSSIVKGFFFKYLYNSISEM